jgi:predicted N-acyltransferase
MEGEAVAGALMYLDDDTLYGRHWGSNRHVDCLHFEACYYQGIDLCIERGLRRFDPGAQGEHKVARGFEPTETRSLHWIAQAPFRRAIADFVSREQRGVRGYIEAVAEHTPYRVSAAS